MLSEACLIFIIQADSTDTYLGDLLHPLSQMGMQNANGSWVNTYNLSHHKAF